MNDFVNILFTSTVGCFVQLKFIELVVCAFDCTFLFALHIKYHTGQMFSICRDI